MKKSKILPVLSVAILFLLPFVMLVSIAFLTPSVYHNTFLAELSNKYERLNTIEDEKIIVIGGSSVAFGLDSQQMEQSLGIPVVNFGLYASLGSKVMLDLSKAAIQPGDIVILAFETDNQTLSMYFNAESMWQAVDCNYSLLQGLSSDDYGKMSGGLYKYVKDKLGFLLNGAPDPAGVYNIRSFDEYGDVSYVRDKNIMSAGFDANQMICFQDIVPDAEFVDYVNAYIEYAQLRGANVCFSFCPMNKQAVTDMEADGKDIFVATMQNVFQAPWISEIDNYIFDSQYFYDTNFHLNDYGTFLRTEQLARDISQYYNLTYTEQDPPQQYVEEPIESEGKSVETIGSAFEDYFLYEDFYGAGWAICGVTEQGLDCKELEIPMYYEGQKVLAILPGAFSNCYALEVITLACGENDSLTLYDGVFSNVETLHSVNIYAMPDSVKVGTEGLLNGAPPNLRFFVEKKNYASYVTNYYWSIYAEQTKIMN